MEYWCTRGGNPVSGREAVFRGLSERGGLYIPSTPPEPLTDEDLTTSDWQQVLALFYQRFLPDWSLSEWEVIVDQAVRQLRGDDHSFELPTRPVNRYLPHLYFFMSDALPTASVYDFSAAITQTLLSFERKNDRRKPFILLLSEGDEATAMAFRRSDASEGRMLLFIPENCIRKDEINAALPEQDSFMTFRSSYDSAAAMIRDLAGDAAFNEEMERTEYRPLFITPGYLLTVLTFGALAAASIALIVQSRTGSSGAPSGDLTNDQRIDFVIPEGHLALLSGIAYAAGLGLPVGTVYTGEGTPGVLSDLLKRGLCSSSDEREADDDNDVDVTIPVNLERILFEILSRDTDRLSTCVETYRSGGTFSLSNDEKKMLSQQMVVASCTSNRAQGVMISIYDRTDHLVDRGTAEAISCWESDTGRVADRDTCVIMARSPLLDDVFAARALFGRKNVRKDREQNVRRLAEETDIPLWPLLQTSFTYNDSCKAISMKYTLAEEVLALTYRENHGLSAMTGREGIKHEQFG